MWILQIDLVALWQVVPLVCRLRVVFRFWYTFGARVRIRLFRGLELIPWSGRSIVEVWRLWSEGGGRGRGGWHEFRLRERRVCGQVQLKRDQWVFWVSYRLSRESLRMPLLSFCDLRRLWKAVSFGFVSERTYLCVDRLSNPDGMMVRMVLSDRFCDGRGLRRLTIWVSQSVFFLVVMARGMLLTLNKPRIKQFAVFGDYATDSMRWNPYWIFLWCPSQVGMQVI